MLVLRHMLQQMKDPEIIAIITVVIINIAMVIHDYKNGDRL